MYTIFQIFLFSKNQDEKSDKSPKCKEMEDVRREEGQVDKKLTRRLSNCLAVRIEENSLVEGTEEGKEGNEEKKEENETMERGEKKKKIIFKANVDLSNLQILLIYL